MVVRTHEQQSTRRPGQLNRTTSTNTNRGSPRLHNPSAQILLPLGFVAGDPSPAPSLPPRSGFFSGMGSPQDPFYIVREEIQGSVGKLQTNFHRWEQVASNSGEYVHLTKELLTSCESIEWQVDELEKTITVASRDPAYYGLDEVELSRRRKWIGSARNQVGTVRRAVEKGKNNSAMARHQDVTDTSRTNHYSSQDNNDFIDSESDRQLLLMRQQDDELDELSASVIRIGDVGLTIHEELSGQERILNDLSLEMETTSNRLDFVQKKVAAVMKKAGIKGQIMLILFLVVVFIILFVLVFLT